VSAAVVAYFLDGLNDFALALAQDASLAPAQPRAAFVAADAPTNTAPEVPAAATQGRHPAPKSSAFLTYVAEGTTAAATAAAVTAHDTRWAAESAECPTHPASALRTYAARCWTGGCPAHVQDRWTTCLQCSTPRPGAWLCKICSTDHPGNALACIGCTGRKDTGTPLLAGTAAFKEVLESALRRATAMHKRLPGASRAPSLASVLPIADDATPRVPPGPAPAGSSLAPAQYTPTPPANALPTGANGESNGKRVDKYASRPGVGSSDPNWRARPPTTTSLPGRGSTTAQLPAAKHSAVPTAPAVPPKPTAPTAAAAPAALAAPVALMAPLAPAATPQKPRWVAPPTVSAAIVAPVTPAVPAAQAAPLAARPIALRPAFPEPPHKPPAARALTASSGLLPALDILPAALTEPAEPMSAPPIKLPTGPLTTAPGPRPAPEPLTASLVALPIKLLPEPPHVPLVTAQAVAATLAASVAPPTALVAPAAPSTPKPSTLPPHTRRLCRTQATATSPTAPEPPPPEPSIVLLTACRPAGIPPAKRLPRLAHGPPIAVPTTVSNALAPKTLPKPLIKSPAAKRGAPRTSPARPTPEQPTETPAARRSALQAAPRAPTPKPPAEQPPALRTTQCKLHSGDITGPVQEAPASSPGGSSGPGGSSYPGHSAAHAATAVPAAMAALVVSAAPAFPAAPAAPQKTLCSNQNRMLPVAPPTVPTAMAAPAAPSVLAPLPPAPPRIPTALPPIAYAAPSRPPPAPELPAAPFTRTAGPASELPIKLLTTRNTCRRHGLHSRQPRRFMFDGRLACFQRTPTHPSRLKAISKIPLARCTASRATSAPASAQRRHEGPGSGAAPRATSAPASAQCRHEGPGGGAAPRAISAPASAQFRHASCAPPHFYVYSATASQPGRGKQPCLKGLTRSRALLHHRNQVHLWSSASTRKARASVSSRLLRSRVTAGEG
jgi:hypothetical protein